MNQITPSATRYHRRALGLTQTGLAQSAGVSTSYVKQFESERLRPSEDFLTKLAEFFQSKDIKPEKLATEYSNGGEIATAPRAREGRMSGMATVPQIKIEERQCFYIGREITPALADDLMMRWEKNEDRIAELFRQQADDGVLSKYSSDTEAALQEVFALLAENFVLFKLLTGWAILDNTGSVNADTVAGVILNHYGDLITIKDAALAGNDEEEDAEAEAAQ